VDREVHATAGQEAGATKSYNPPFAAGLEDNCALAGAGGVFIFGMPC
jgi:hypothetical protein